MPGNLISALPVSVEWNKNYKITNSILICYSLHCRMYSERIFQVQAEAQTEMTSMRFRATASEISDFKFSFWLFALFKLKFDATFPFDRILTY